MGDIMAQGKISGFAWHVEKRGYKNEQSRNCFNCINYDEHWCRKHDTSITCNNAKKCNFFENVNKLQDEEVVAIKRTKYEKNNENKKKLSTKPSVADEIFSFSNVVKDKKYVNKAEYGCIVKLRNRNTLEVIEVAVVKEKCTKLPQIIRKCIGKSKGNYFQCKNSVYQIIDIYK